MPESTRRATFSKQSNPYNGLIVIPLIILSSMKAVVNILFGNAKKKVVKVKRITK
jgi:hypothetical protein